MSDYTPTTDRVREAYARGVEFRTLEQTRAEFDRWLAQHDAEVRTAALNAVVLPEAEVEPCLVEWATEVDTIGTKEIYDTEGEARAAADKDDLRLFRIEWMEVEK